VITASGADWVEEHLPSNKILYRLLKAAESGRSRTESAEGWQENSHPPA
jgi:CRISPR/Cas system CMR subunit Cmr4 (Cas7 group RAMP superfamily)